MTTTALVVTISFITLGIYDLVVVTFFGTGKSISRFLQGTALRHPFVGFVFGFIAGHLFGYMNPEEDGVRGVTEVVVWWLPIAGLTCLYMLVGFWCFVERMLDWLGGPHTGNPYRAVACLLVWPLVLVYETVTERIVKWQK